jgi:hypothetical protein
MAQTFTVNAELLFETLTLVIILSLFLERALALVFENRWLVQRLSGRGIKEPVAFVASFLVCQHWHFDAVSGLFNRQGDAFGFVLTAAIIAGGSKASIVLFQNVIGAMSTAEAERRKLAPPAP